MREQFKSVEDELSKPIDEELSAQMDKDKSKLPKKEKKQALKLLEMEEEIDSAAEVRAKDEDSIARQVKQTDKAKTKPRH